MDYFNGQGIYEYYQLITTPPNIFDNRKRNGKIQILGKSNKNPRDQKAVIKLLRIKYE